MALRLMPVPPERKQRHELEQEAEALLRERLHCALAKTNSSGRREFTEALKRQGVRPETLMRLMQEAQRDKAGLLVWERKIAGMYDMTTLAHVRATSSFSSVLVAVRELYADDNALYVTYAAACNAVIEEVLLAK